MEDSKTWRPVPGFDRYEVSSCGAVRSVAGKRAPRVLKPCTSNGYLHVSLYDGTKVADGKRHRGQHRWVHRLVLGAFVGPCPDGMEARHLNNDRGDNRLENLAWGTRVENARDKEAHGTVARGSRHGSHTQPHRWQRGDAHHSRRMPHLRPRGEDHGNSKLTNVQREQIAVHKGFVRLCSLAEVFEVHTCTILKIQKAYKRSA